MSFNRLATLIIATLALGACNLPAASPAHPVTPIAATPAAGSTPTVVTPAATATTVPTSTDTPTAFPTPTDTEKPSDPTFTPEVTPQSTAVPACFALLSPSNGATLDNTKKAVFKWEAMPSAASYVILFVLPSGNIERFSLNGTQYERTMQSLPLAGKYNWQVSALDSNGKHICIAGMFQFFRPATQPTQRPPKDDGGGDYDYPDF